MSQSKAKKHRKKLDREGFRNPEKDRLRNVGLYPRVKESGTVYKRKGRTSPEHMADERPSFILQVQAM